jgi:glycosyltransferase involved in cell wall biosynthesis
MDSKMMTSFLSVVMTVYNRRQYLAKAIESVLAQTRKDFELLIWDDGSIDGSIEIAKHYAERDQRIKVITAEHRGQGRALKAAIAATTGDYVGQVDSDDFLALNALKETAAVLDQNPTVGLVYTDYLVIDEKGVVKGYGSRCQIPYSKERLLVDFMIFHFRLMRRSVYDQSGGINEVFESIEDYELCLRLSEITEIQHLNQPLYYYRTHRHNLSIQKQIEQIYLAQQAINQALERRGLSAQFESDVQIVGKFSLRKRQ